MKIILHYTRFLVLTMAAMIAAFPALSQTAAINSITNSKHWKITPFERKAFIENKGQFDNILPAEKKAFQYCIDKGQQVLFYQDGLSYRFSKRIKSKEPLFGFLDSEEKREERERTATTKIQYIHLKWLNSNPNAAIVSSEKQTTYYSYVVGNTGETPSTVMCDGYSKITYKDLYPGIDVEYVFHPDNGIKYNLLLHPGADISKVKMQYDENSKLFIKNGDLHISTIVGDIIDHAPVTFYEGNKEKIGSGFTLAGNVVSFNLAAHETDKEIVVDPWTVVPGFAPGFGYDNGVANNGEVYVYGGGQGNYTVEKYPAAGGAPIWSLANSGLDRSYYGDMLVEGSGNFYLCEGFVVAGAKTFKYDPTSALIWQSTSDGDYREHWRLALNCITNKVIVAGGGTTTPTLNIAEIDITTGVLINAKSNHNAHEDMAGLCVDETGQSYLIGAISNRVFFTDNANNTVASAPNGYNMSEIGIGSPTYYPANSSNGYNCMALGGTSFLFTSDGATLKKWDRNTYALISSVVIPGGQQNLGGGILADKCNNIFVGASNGVYRFDFNLVQKEYQATATAVYDIAYTNSSDIVASGDGFVQTLPFGREPCGATTVTITSDPCNPEINTVKVVPTQGTPPFTYLWDDGNTDSVRTNLSMGIHVVSIKDGTCTPSFFTDTVEITNSNTALTIQKTNPLCVNAADGDITITLLSNQQITSVTWTPVITNTMLNDSTTQATGLTSGIYNCFITSDLGCSYDTAITLSDQFPNPAADFVDAQACEGAAIQFNETSTASSGIINSWSWNFGDNTALSNAQNPSHTYADSGTYTATLIVTTADGCTDTIQKDVLIHPVPEANFSFDNVCEGSIAFLNDESTIAPPDIIQLWTWDFGDGDPFKNNQNTIHLYPGVGSYNAELSVTSNFGCKDSITKVITINPKPVISFTASDTINCSPLCVDFQSNVNLASGTVGSYAWDYGDPGTTENSPNGNHCYTNNTSSTGSPQPLSFNVSLTVTSDSGCVTSLSKNNYITVYPNPIASFTADPQVVSIMNPGITFTNQSLGENSWDWDFGDLSTSTDSMPPAHTYADTGTYTITLNISNQYGCLDSTYRTVIIEPDWAFFIPNVFTPNGDGINDTFQGYGYGMLEYSMTIFDRWGNRIYDTNDYDKPWDGKANHGSDISQQDVYVYQFTIKDNKGLKHNYSGIVSLVR